MISLIDITKRFGHVEVLRGINHSFTKGEVTCIIGPSGSGKSTLLRCINFLEQPTSGVILIEGERVLYAVENGSPRLHPERRIVAVRRKLGMVFQDFALFPHLTALGNVTEGLVFGLAMDKSEATRIAGRFLDRVGL